MCEYVNIWRLCIGVLASMHWIHAIFHACLAVCTRTHARTHTHTHTHRRGARVNGVEHIPTALVADSGQIRADIEGARK